MNRIALITGGTQGLGLALVEGLAARLDAGDIVYLTGRTRERIAEAVAGLAPGRAEVRTQVLDVSDTVSVDRAAAEIAERHGGVDIVFSNAYRRVQPGDNPAEVIADYVDTNNLGDNPHAAGIRSFGP